LGSTYNLSITSEEGGAGAGEVAKACISDIFET
jgi:hypothetical protein